MEGKQKVLVIVNTYFQLMTAIQLVLKVYIKADVDFIITDNLISYNEISKKIEERNIISKVYRAKTRSITIPRTRADKFKAVLYTISSEKFIKQRTDFVKDKYDLLLFHNLDVFTYIIYSYIVKENPNTRLGRYEEGFSIYLTFNDRLKSEKICEWIFKILRRKSIVKNISVIYLYHKEYLTYKIPYHIENIPLLSKTDETYKSVINYIFQYDGNNIETRLAIIFEECFFADKTPIDDYSLFCRVIQIVGAQKTSIKLHPRNLENRFCNTGALVFNGGNAPWEVLQLNGDYTDNILITITSGSVLASMLYFNEPISIIFLYKIVGGNFKIKKNYDIYLQKVCNNNPNTKIYIPKSQDELSKILGEIVS